MALNDTFIKNSAKPSGKPAGDKYSDGGGLYLQKCTVFTTNRPFKEWHEVFPNAACVVSLIDRLVHRCEIVALDGQSYRLKEAKRRAEAKAAHRSANKRTVPKVKAS